MDTARLRRELVSSLRLPAGEERRVVGGAGVALVAYGLWVGATGAALKYATDVAGRPVTVDPWTGTTTAVLAVVALLWVLGPALLGTYLLVGELTNVSGNLEHHYRVRYPSVLVAPPAVLFGLVAAAGVALGGFPVALLAALVALGHLVLVRTLAYSYRVFSLSVPRLVQAFVVASLGALAVALLAGGAVVAGRGAFVADAARGVGDLLGTRSVAAAVTGTTDVAGATLPTLPGIAAGLPVTLASAYLLVQVPVGLVGRLRGVTVPRSRLRTGQRYPEFARPTVERSTGTPTGNPGPTTGGTPDGTADSDGSGGDPAAGTADAADAAGNDDGGTGPATDDAAAGETDRVARENVSHTKVYTPPDDAGEVPADGPDAAAGGTGEEARSADGDGEGGGNAGDGGAGAAGDETRVVAGESGHRCPTCGDTFPGDTGFAYCPTCGTELEPV